MSTRTRRQRQESGAVAIVVALMSVVLFGTAALAVDLGNAWSRKRQVQKQVDISALSAGYMLPMVAANKAAIADEVAVYLNDVENLAVDQDTVTGPNLIDGVPENGEIFFQNKDDSACTDNCAQMRVLAPPAEVGFGLANAIGFGSGDVRRSATVLVESELPSRRKTLPFWFPSNCGLGPSESDTANGNGPPPAPTTTSAAPSATATSTASPGYTPGPSESGNHALNGASPYNLLQGGNMTIDGLTVSGVPNNTDRVSLRFYRPGGLTYLEKAAVTTGIGSTVSIPSVVVGTEVSNTIGTWQIFAMVEKNNKTTFSATQLILNVNPISTASPTPTPSPTVTETSIPVGCVGSDKGNFGQLDSPRTTGGPKQARLALNIALGLDHNILPYVPVSGGPQNPTVCEPGGTLIPGAKLDEISRPGNNCIQGDTGNDGPKMYEGMISGINASTPGRLDANANGHTSPLCTALGFNDVVVGSTLINNDRLSCFLRNGATLGQVSQSSGVTQAMLDPAVIKSPRFVWLPVVFAADRAQHGFQPIKKFVPGFITDETQTTAATAANGLDINGNSIKVIHVFTFNRDALPLSETSDTTDYDPEIGGSIVRLVG